VFFEADNYKRIVFTRFDIDWFTVNPVTAALHVPAFAAYIDPNPEGALVR